MAFYDSDILIRNIKQLMADNDITQEQLAEILGMSQPNVSKALSERDKKAFTLEQVVGIAKHFGTSVDMLVGNYKAKYIGTSPRAIAAFIAEVLDNHVGLLRKIPSEEDIYEINPYDNPYDGASYRKATNEYQALYLPNYWPVPKDCAPDNEVLTEYSQVGNGTRMFEVNTFLQQFKEIFDIYDRHGLSEETYQTVLADLLSHLNDT